MTASRSTFPPSDAPGRAGPASTTPTPATPTPTTTDPAATGRAVPRRAVGAALAAALVPGGAAPAGAAEESWPSRAVRLLVPYPPGQATDIVFRVMADELSKRWPQRAFVENRAGGAGTVGTEAGARSAPDGYTITASTSGTHGINPSIVPNLAYDAERDFAYVTTVFTVPLLIVAHPSFAPRDVPALVEAARAAPGRIPYGSGGPGTSQHMSAEMFCFRAGVRLNHVSYRGSGPAVADLLAGNIPLMFDSLASALPHIRAGRIRPIAVTTAARTSQLPEVPAIAEALPGFEALGWAGFCVPVATPAALVRRINADATAILRDPAIAARIVELGAAAAPQSPEECTAFVRQEIAKWREVARAANVRLEG